jgi:hypothetical protein
MTPEQKAGKSFAWLSEPDEHAHVFIRMRDFARTIFGLPAVIGQRFVCEWDSAAKVAFEVIVEHVAEAGISVPGKRVPVDHNRPNAIMQELQLNIGGLPEDRDRIGLEQQKRIDMQRVHP